jgi:ribosomal-protein-alanine N-acetyltransferase
MTISIRPGREADLPAITAIQAASPEAAAWPVADYLLYDLRVAEADGLVAGFVAARAVAGVEAEILNLAVSPAARRKGVGRALLGAFLEGFAGDVFLEVRDSNRTALEFYKSFGFKEFTIRRGYYQDPPEAAIVMKFHSC